MPWAKDSTRTLWSMRFSMEFKNTTKRRRWRGRCNGSFEVFRRKNGKEKFGTIVLFCYD